MVGSCRASVAEGEATATSLGSCGHAGGETRGDEERREAPPWLMSGKRMRAEIRKPVYAQIVTRENQRRSTAAHTRSRQRAPTMPSSESKADLQYRLAEGYERERRERDIEEQNAITPRLITEVGL